MFIDGHFSTPPAPKSGGPLLTNALRSYLSRMWYTLRASTVQLAQTTKPLPELILKFINLDLWSCRGNMIRSSLVSCFFLLLAKTHVINSRENRQPDAEGLVTSPNYDKWAVNFHCPNASDISHGYMVHFCTCGTLGSTSPPILIKW